MTLSKHPRHPRVQSFLFGLADLLDKRPPLPGRLPDRIQRLVIYLRYIAGGSTVIDPPPKTGGLTFRIREWVLGPDHSSASLELAIQ
jgi:hypothetical protein